MTPVIFHTATTLNGFLADDADSLDWLFATPGADEAESDFSTFLETVGVLVMGSTTYNWVVEHEDLLSHPDRWTDIYGDRPTWVFTSRDLPRIEGADVRFVQGEVAPHWAGIRDAAGDRAVWIVGGGDLAGQFADADLLTEIRVSIAPATLPSGRPLLPRRIGPDRLRLEGMTRAGQFAELRYSVRPA
ncbi:dihydrofolate reductase [Microbacterium sp. AK009]|uniref:dihydrofolate reductase family protein n=1 Tax=Microbacterium sp. AK009 TaxID=2723068 RepID=UPI0015C6D169|nr:dihydrofolate reductase family protein [Microbacterium sp. AK009]NYF16056.1 dihydrofolate reductase [Microbacterium sp. AK009]